ncbi:MAG: MerR family transcriptional regulator [Lachnospiraceae bacterium]|nr:MerR family transcriptional regulator [Lachnospiraceae bacterium]
MMEKRVSISDAAKQLSVEAHVLRYWELELGLNISRNSQGHRFYKPEDILLLKQIKYLKDQGFRLQAIKLLLTDISNTYTMGKEELWELRDYLNGQVQQDEAPFSENHTAQIMPLHPKNPEPQKALFKAAPYNYNQTEEKLRHFEAMMRKMIRTTLEDMALESEDRICDKVSTRLLKEIDYLERQKDELQEKQLALLQDILAEIKKDGVEAAATMETDTGKQSSKKKKERKKKLFAKSAE